MAWGLGTLINLANKLKRKPLPNRPLSLDALYTRKFLREYRLEQFKKLDAPKVLIDDAEKLLNEINDDIDLRMIMLRAKAGELAQC